MGEARSPKELAGLAERVLSIVHAECDGKLPEMATVLSLSLAVLLRSWSKQDRVKFAEFIIGRLRKAARESLE
jgi:hypothetical protein